MTTVSPKDFPNLEAWAKHHAARPDLNAEERRFLSWLLDQITKELIREHLCIDPCERDCRKVNPRRPTGWCQRCVRRLLWQTERDLSQEGRKA